MTTIAVRATAKVLGMRVGDTAVVRRTGRVDHLIDRGLLVPVGLDVEYPEDDESY